MEITRTLEQWSSTVEMIQEEILAKSNEAAKILSGFSIHSAEMCELEKIVTSTRAKSELATSRLKDALALSSLCGTLRYDIARAEVKYGVSDASSKLADVLRQIRILELALDSVPTSCVSIDALQSKPEAVVGSETTVEIFTTEKVQKLRDVLDELQVEKNSCKNAISAARQKKLKVDFPDEFLRLFGFAAE